MLGYWAADARDDVPLAREAERLGYRSVWTAEAYGSDAVSTLAWIGANTSRIELGTGLMQVSARTPACTAMTAVTMDHLTGGRFSLGLGVSGPQVVEGWYGQPFPAPLARTREYVGILRDIWAREGPVTNDGEHYPLPHPDGTGLGKPLKITTHPLRSDLPVLLGAEGPKNVALAAEIADGWLPIFMLPDRFDDLYGETLAAADDGWHIACPVHVVVDDDVEEALLAVKLSLAFYIGGMGAERANFHKDVIGRMGFADGAERVQKLFLDGDREAAVHAVPDALADGIALCGPPGRIRERLQAWIASPVDTLLVMSHDPATLRLLADALS
ncbi:MAG: LLM class F420-dependent oxidoreductase [Actinobacteria bacterium]|nr:LLM class F420-dependent oxidoreductase [Actinomycetota bacterium]